jgi:hypothetical protein
MYMWSQGGGTLKSDSEVHDSLKEMQWRAKCKGIVLVTVSLCCQKTELVFWSLLLSRIVKQRWMEIMLIFCNLSEYIFPYELFVPVECRCWVACNSIFLKQGLWFNVICSHHLTFDLKMQFSTFLVFKQFTLHVDDVAKDTYVLKVDKQLVIDYKEFFCTVC